jgi:predicted anti-sigma-YlaC factor YlaD
MREPTCPEESRVVRARQAGDDDPFVRGHLAACEACRETLETLEFMRTLASHPMDPAHRIPEAARIWWRAQLVRRWEAERRVAQRVDRMYPVQAAVLAFGIVLGVWLSWPLVERWMEQTELGGATLLVMSLVPAGMVTSVIGGGVLLAVVMLAMMRDVMAE